MLKHSSNDDNLKDLQQVIIIKSVQATVVYTGAPLFPRLCEVLTIDR